jgi:DNA-binding NtrC family response regulator
MNGEVMQILLVEDSEADAILLLAELEGKGLAPLHQRVETQEDFLAALQNRSWDAVIADYVLPHFGGPVALKLLRNRGFDIPFIMVSSVVGEEKAAEMMKAGANDYILKADLSRLVPALERELKAAQNRRLHKRALVAMQYLAVNLHELQTVVERAGVICGGNGIPEPEHAGPLMNDSNSITAATAPADIGTGPGVVNSPDEFPTLKELEKRHIFAALDRCKDNRSRAAKLLGTSARTLRSKLHEYNGTSTKAGDDKAVAA